MTESPLRAGQPWGAHRRHGRRYPTYSRELGGGLFANVVNGVVSSVGVEPVGDWVVRRSGRVEGARPHRSTCHVRRSCGPRPWPPPRSAAPRSPRASRSATVAAPRSSCSVVRRGRAPRRRDRASPSTTARRWARGTRCPAIPASFARGFVKLCAAPPYRFMRQSTPAARISSSNAVRCSGGISGSSVPMQTRTRPLMFSASSGRLVCEARVEADDRLQVGAAAGELERHRAAEAVADRGDPRSGLRAGCARSTSRPP